MSIVINEEINRIRNGSIDLNKLPDNTLNYLLFVSVEKLEILRDTEYQAGTSEAIKLENNSSFLESLLSSIRTTIVDRRKCGRELEIILNNTYEVEE